uniref:Protein kinase domain-containing protein n=1 Tax=Loa loa TaxID=7209 RepID=A0A1I7VIZ6_LOALO
MLRVNPERRADIDEIASHWWLNLDENMPVIQELPENQIVDHTPLTDRAETMIVQDLADEADVFMDFGHLSPSTRLKIEEFRRRRKEAEEYIENSPIKPPKTRKTDGTEMSTLTAAEKSLRHDPRLNKEKERERVTVEEPDAYYEPLERLKRLESRLQSKDNQVLANKEIRRFKQPTLAIASECDSSGSRMKNKNERLSPEQPDDPVTSNSKISEKSTGTSNETSKPSFVPLDSEAVIAAAKASRKPSAETWRLEMDSLNILMNQVLEQMEKGPVSMTLVARIKAHPFYDSRPMVKELLESIIAAQPPSVQKQASKLIQQQSQELIKRQTAGAAIATSIGGTTVGITGRRSSKTYENATTTLVKVDEKRIPGKYQPNGIAQCNGQMKNYSERPWHSVEVGFDPDEDAEHNIGTVKSFSHNDELTEETVQDTSFEDASDGEIILDGDRNQSKVNPLDHDESLKESEECDDEDDEEVEESDSEIDELGKEVEQIEDEENASYRTALSEENLGDSGENNPPPDPHMKVVAPQFVDAFDRGLAKRQSKGKYQAKKYIMTYPKPIDDSGDDIPGRLGKKIVKNWLRTQDPDVMVTSTENPAEIASRVCSVPPRSPPNEMKSDDEVSESESDDDEEDDEDENEESDEEVSSEESEANKVAPNKQPVEVENRKSQVISPEADHVIGDTKYQMKPKAKEEHNKKDVSLTTRKANKPIKLGNRSLAIPSYDAAASFLRRHNWDRRRRNRTIDVSENVLKSITDHRDEVTPSRYAVGHTMAATNDPVGLSLIRTTGTPTRSISPGLTIVDRTLYPTDLFYAHNKFLNESNGKHLASPGYPNSAIYGQNTRYNDDSFRKTAEKDATSPTRLNAGLNHNLYTARDDKRKSKSAHDLSPDRPDSHTGTNTNVNKLAAPGSSIINRYDNESSVPQSWALEPKRFYVYQTRAEREAEKNTAVSNLHPSSTYRMPASSWYSGTSTGNHSISSYASDYKSRYDDNYPYRRNNNYDSDTGTGHNAEMTPNIQNQTNHESSNAATYRYRPAGRHIASVLGDPTRRIYGRSNSMERSALRQDDLDYFGFRNFVTTSDMHTGDKAEYSYVNFHDTAVRGSTPHEPDHSKLPTRGILKNKQNAENDSSRASTEISSTGSGQGIVGGKDQTSAASGKVSKDEPSKAAKKRSLFLALGRRRTTEMRLGPDGKITVPGLESDFKRPSSPIDKIKSLFRKSKESVAMPAASQQLPSNYAHLDYANFLSSPSSRYGFTDKVYGVYPSSHLTPSFTRDPFASQYRKYTGKAAITTPGSTSSNYNRYSYTTGANDRALRHWHEDPHPY